MQRHNFEDVKSILVQYLEEKNLRKTPERFAILEEIYSDMGHFDVDSLYVSMKNKNYRISRATIYNTLDLLLECDLVVKHRFGEKLSIYEKAYHYKQHDHLICLECNAIFEFCDPRVQNIQKMVEDFHHFKVKTHALHFYGNCQREKCEYRAETQPS